MIMIVAMIALITAMGWFRFDTHLIDRDLICITRTYTFYARNNRARYITKSGIVVQFRDSEMYDARMQYGCHDVIDGTARGIGLARTKSGIKMSPSARLQCIASRSFVALIVCAGGIIVFECREPWVSKEWN